VPDEKQRRGFLCFCHERAPLTASVEKLRSRRQNDNNIAAIMSNSI